MKTKLPFSSVALLFLLALCQPLQAQDWQLTGNNGTIPPTNFLGTTDKQSLVFKTFNLERMRILGNGKIGIGVLTPLQKLHVNGNINIDSGFALYMQNHRVLFVDSLKSNIFLGNGTGAANSTGINNTASGYYALYSNSTGYSNTANGTYALYSNTGSYNTANGTYALSSNTTGSYNTANGVNALYSNTSGFFNTANGYNTLYSNTTGRRNTANASEALYSNTTGTDNSANGYNALYSNTTGWQNTANGNYALYLNNGVQNTANGYNALYFNSTGSWNTANGTFSLYYNSTGTYNIANGYLSLYTNSIGHSNVANGCYSLYNNTGSYNTANGFAGLDNNVTGNYNTALGYGADVLKGNFINATAIGSEAIVNASNKVRIGNTSVTSIGGQVGWTVFSDGRYKKNIKEDVQGLSFINSLRPITYTVDINSLNAYYDKGRKYESAYEKKDMQPSSDEASKIVYNGFIAQDVEKAAKKLNYEFSGVDKPQSEDGLYGLRYAEFVVPLVKAVQELSKMNDEKDTKIDALQKQIDELKSVVFSGNPAMQNKNAITLSNASLEQNIPNPFNNTTTINYTLPQTYTSAILIITDKMGKALKEVNVSGNGKGSLKIEASTLSSGAYQYSLYVDGKLIDTKQMMLAK